MEVPPGGVNFTYWCFTDIYFPHINYRYFSHVKKHYIRMTFTLPEVISLRETEQGMGWRIGLAGVGGGGWVEIL